MTPGSQGGPDLRPALSRLIRVFPAVFAAEYWGQKPLLSRSSELGQDFSDLFSPEAVDELVADRALRTPFARMVKSGSLLDTGQFTSGGHYGAEIGDQLDADKILREFSTGSTLVLQGLHRSWQPLARFSRQLVADIGRPVKINSYVTPTSSVGFNAHYDTHDVFVIQIAGEKRWTVHEPVHQNPLPSQGWEQYSDAVHERVRQPPYFEETFLPGDVLYLPRGWVHAPATLGRYSVHLTIGIETHTRADLAQRMINKLGTNPALRASLPMGPERLTAEALQQIVREASAELIEMLKGDDFADEIAAEAARALMGAAKPDPVHLLASTDAANALTADTIVRWRPGFSTRTRRTVDAIVVVGVPVRLPLEAAAAVEALAHGASIRVGDLPELDADSALVVARRLVREAVLAIQ